MDERAHCGRLDSFAGEIHSTRRPLNTDQADAPAIAAVGPDGLNTHRLVEERAGKNLAFAQSRRSRHQGSLAKSLGRSDQRFHSIPRAAGMDANRN